MPSAPSHAPHPSHASRPSRLSRLRTTAAAGALALVGAAGGTVAAAAPAAADVHGCRSFLTAREMPRSDVNALCLTSGESGKELCRDSAKALASKNGQDLGMLREGCDKLL